MKHTKTILMLAVAAVLFSSCKKDLNQQPTDTFNENNAFLNLNDIQLATNEAYVRYGAYANDMYTSALVSDEAKIGLNNGGQGALTYRFQYNSDATSGGDVVGAWGAYYTVISQCNTVLGKIDNVTIAASEVERKDELKGQLLALRAICHFGLLQSYSNNYNAADPLGVPVVLIAYPTAKPARNSMGEVMAQIEADLTTAKSLIPNTVSFTDTVMNKVNIAAYQARIALYKGDYDAAVTYSSEVIAANEKPLVSGSQFAAIWTDDTDDEVLFRIRYETSTGIGSLWTTTGGDIYIAPSDKLVNSYDVDDVRLSAYIGDDGSGNHYVNKFFESGRGGRVVDMKACRISEMYLIRAEANARKASPDLTAATNDLNELRSNRIDFYTPASFGSASLLIDAIMEERFKELAFEGFRFFDLKRNNLPVQRLSTDASAAWQTLDAGNFRFVFPIPNDELLANPAMVQNLGY